MTQPLDQLVYGWSEHGLEGRNRLQMVATTPGWSEDNKYRRVAQRLARLEAAGDRYPVSFGWADVGGRRFVFRRTLVPSTTGDARRLVAHIVAGAPEELPASLLLRAYDSTFWWRGEPRDGQVAAMRPEDLVAGWSDEQEPAPTVTSDALLQRILAAPAGAPATYEGDWRDTYACLWGIQRSVPGLLDSLSCSTYESGQMVTWFDLTGLDGRPRPHGAPWCGRNASEPSYSEAQSGDLADLVATATPVVSTGGGSGRKVFREVMRVGERIVSGHTASVAGMLTYPQTLPIVLGSRSGVHGVADAMWALDRQQWPALAMEPDVSRRLTDLAVATADAATPEADASLTAVARRLQTINPELGTVFVERVLERRANDEPLPRPDHGFLSAALGWAYHAPISEAVVAALLVWAAENANGRLVADRRLPDAWRTWLFGQASARGQLGAADYAHLIDTHPGLFDDDGWLPADEWIVADAIAGSSAPLRAAASRAFCAKSDAATVARRAVQMRAEGRLLGSAALLQALAAQPDVSLDAASTSAVWQLLGELAVASVTGRLDLGLLELPWRIADALADDSSWSAAAGRQFSAGRYDVGVRMQAWPAELLRFDGAARAAFTEVVLHDIVLHARTAGGFATWSEGIDLSVMSGDDTARAVLTALQRRTGTARQLMLPFAIALSAAVTRSGFLGLRVSAGQFEEPLREQVRRIRSESEDAFAEARSVFGWAVSRWLRRNGAF